MRRELANSLLKAKIKIKQIGGLTKSLSKYGRVWTWIAYLLKLILNMNMKISILFLASKSYQNINLDQINNRDINLMIIFLIFYQNFNFLGPM